LLTTIAQVDPIWVLFSIAQADYERIRANPGVIPVEMVGPDGNVESRGQLTFAAPTVDPKLATVQLRAQFANPESKWMPGQFVRVRALAGEREALLVPRAAVLQNEQGHFVWTVVDGKATAKPVQTANWIGGDWVVTGGLAPNDQVIVDNVIKLRPGAAVAPHRG
jgi:membrane fusion protein, multidrug efflux system